MVHPAAAGGVERGARRDPAGAGERLRRGARARSLGTRRDQRTGSHGIGGYRKGAKVCALLLLGAVVSVPVAAQRANPTDDGKIHLGVSVLLNEQVSLIRNRNILLVTDELTRDERGRLTRDLFEKDRRVAAARVRLVGVVMAPVVPGAPIGPTVAALDSLVPLVQGVVIDLVDHGSRSGHVAPALLATLRAASRGKVPVILLDRPNPITGEHAEGPVADSVTAILDGVYGLPQRHGMTVGEMAKWFTIAGRIDVALTVVPVRGWRRSWWPSEHGLDLPRFRQSTPSAEQLMVAAALGLFDATNLSWDLGPGRRSIRVGAPWLDAHKVAKALGDRLIPGVEFSVGRDVFAGRVFPSVRVEVASRDNVNGLRVVAAMLSIIRQFHPDSLRLDVQRVGELSGSVAFGRDLAAGDDSDVIIDRQLPLLMEFRRRARDAYLYR